MVTLEKRTISYLSVSVRIRVIDLFSQMKRQYNTILHDADSANSNNFICPISKLHMLLSGKRFSRWPIHKTKLLTSTETSFRRALISNNCHLCYCVKERIVGREKSGGGGGGKIVILSTSTSTQIPNHKTSSKARDLQTSLVFSQHPAWVITPVSP